MSDEKRMERQIQLRGIEQLPSLDTDNLLIFRRSGDRHGPQTRDIRDDLEGTGSCPDGKGSYPVRIYTLGRFSLLLQGQPAVFGRKTPHRPLDLLKAIVACGGRDISLSMLTTVLWPDSDGDDAKRTFDTTLFRLRKILGHDRVITLRDGKVSLDPSYCWTDVWAFERMAGRLNRIRKLDTAGENALALDQLGTQLLALYQDHFLAREDMTPWSVSLRERLRSKFIHILLETGRYWETHGFWEKAMACYQKGLDVDDLIESFYQRLMVCQLELQRYSEGMSTYRRCCRVLSISLGLQPEAETESIYQNVKRARANLQTA